MRHRYVTLPNGRACGLGVYVRAWKTLRTLKADDSVSGFGHFAEPASDVLRTLRDGMHDRINRHAPGFGRGRKWSNDWQREAIQCAHAVRDGHGTMLCRCTLAEFLRDNNAMDDGDIGALRTRIAKGEEWHCGGGAAAFFIVAPDTDPA
jgi:hypothetical protein